MRGVCDQLALRSHRVVQRGQHGVERRAEAAHLVGSGGAEASSEVAGLSYVLGSRGELADRAEEAPGREPGNTVGDARGRDGEPGEQQGGVAQRAVVGVRGSAGADQGAARGVRHGRGVDAEPLPAVVRFGEVRRLGALRDGDVAAVQRPEPGGLTGSHRPRKQLDLDAPDGDRLVDVGCRSVVDGRLLDALGDRGGLLGGVDEARVDTRPQALRIRQIQHAADRGDHDQHPGRGGDRDPVPQRHCVSRST